ncbi:MAG TPA: hypothetical protein ENN73_00345, partial [Firmicutes bacterium]|nr:hypothetical protein [Bacillota bacterium]
ININALKKLGSIYLEQGNIDDAASVFDELFEVLRIEIEIDTRILEFEKKKHGKKDFRFPELNRRFEMILRNHRRLLLNHDEIYVKLRALKEKELQDKFYRSFTEELSEFRKKLNDRLSLYDDLQKSSSVRFTREEVAVMKNVREIDLNDYFWSIYREGKLHRDYNDIKSVEEVFGEWFNSSFTGSDPEKNIVLWNILSDYYWELGFREKLHDFLEQVIDQTGADPRFKVKKSVFYFLEKDYKQSSAIIVSHSKDITDFSSYNLISESFSEKNQRIIADYFLFISDFDSKNRFDLLQQSGLIYAQSFKDYSSAKKVFNKLIEFYPDSYKGYFSLGSVYFIEGKYPETLKNWEKALELAPENKELQNNVRLIKERLKEK